MDRHRTTRDESQSRFDRRTLLSSLAALATTTMARAAEAAAPLRRGYPRSYERIVEIARREKQLTIYSAARSQEVAELLADFRTLYPFISIRYEGMQSFDVYRRFMAEAGANRVVVDLLINSAMDLQIKLVNDGYIQPYASPEKPNLPDWAVWKNEAYAVSAEPIVFVYNKRLMPAADVPRSHDALQSLLERKYRDYNGKIALYNPEVSSTGFLCITQDVQIDRDTWKLIRALGRSNPKLYRINDEIIPKIRSGQHWLAYNMVASYALAQQSRDPNLGIIVPNDYTLVLSRIALIPKDAPHPASAKLFLDYLLSRRGQSLLGKNYMTPLREDVPWGGARVDPSKVQAIRVGPALLANLDQLKRANFLKQWRRAIANS